MKKKVRLVLIIMLVQLDCFAQEFPHMYFDSSVTWLGLDYSNSRMVGAQGFVDPDQIVNHYFDVWNKFVITEPKKYNLKRFLIQSNITINLTYVSDKNKIDPKGIVYEVTNPLSIEKLQEIINGYDFSELTGFGAMMIVESYDKNKETAIYHFVIVDLDDNKLLHHKKHIAAPFGFGFRNYWAASFLIALQKTEKDLNSMWWKTKKARKKR